MSLPARETVSFVTFLEYRARHPRAHRVDPVPPDVVTPPPDVPEPDVVAVAMPRRPRV